MNKKGFTLIEVMITVAIIAILLAIMIPAFIDKANGMEIQKLMPADDATVKEVARLLEQDPYLTVVLLTYATDWNTEITAPLIKESKVVFRTLVDKGVLNRQINWLFANSGGLTGDAMPTPAADGIYLYLE